MAVKRFRIGLAGNRLGQVVFTFKETLKLVNQASSGYLVVILGLNILWGLSNAPAFYLEKLILDKLVANIGNPLWAKVLSSLTLLILARVGLEIFRNSSSRVSEFLRRMLSRKFSAYLEIVLARKINQLDISTLEAVELKDRLNKVQRESARRAWNLVFPLAELPGAVSGLAASGVILWLLHPLVVILVVLVSIPQFLVDAKFIKLEYQRSSREAPLYRLWGWISYQLTRNRNFMELKILNLADYLTRKSESLAEKIYSERVELEKKKEKGRFGAYLPTVVMETILNLWLAMGVLTTRVTVGSMEMFIRAFRSSQANLSQLVSSLLSVYENYLYVVDLRWFLDLKPKIDPKKGKTIQGTKEVEVGFEKVWFRYREDQPWVLKGVSFKIKPEERVAIVGENGVGKSTIVKLLCRFYDPDKGRVVINGRDLKEIKPVSWWKLLAVMFQEFETYPYTAQESIGFGEVRRLKELGKIRAVAKKTGIDEFIESLPLKYQNPLAVDFNQGVNLSIGQWQRVVLARTLFKETARLLILDEPTANVDPKAEERIFNQLLETARRKGLVFISQRFSTVRRADRILVVDKGRIVEEGSHEELMKLKGQYARLFGLQAKRYK